jgi:hypothetical protein
MIAHTPVEVYLPVEQRFWKRLLIVDDDKDITITFKGSHPIIQEIERQQ